jgi:hypothetical protein
MANPSFLSVHPTDKLAPSSVQCFERERERHGQAAADAECDIHATLFLLS